MKNILLILVLAIAGCVSTDSYVGDMRQGIIEWEGKKSINSEHIAGYSSTADSYWFVRETDVIPAQKGITFALEYETNFPEDKITTVREIVIYPEAGLTNPHRDKTTYYSFLEHETYGNDRTVMFYKLSEDWEVVEGEWIFKVEVNGKEIIRKKFTTDKI